MNDQSKGQLKNIALMGLHGNAVVAGGALGVASIGRG